MKETSRNYYKECRENAKLSQEQAAELLDISIRSLSDYENGKTIPPDDTVEKMVDVYHARLLGWVHLRNTSSLAMKCILEVQEPRSEADILLQVIFSEDDVLDIKKKMKEILKDGKITEDEVIDFNEVKKRAKIVAGKLLSIAVYEPEFE